MTGGDEPLVDVRLLRYPLRIAARATQHYDDVFREFALMAGDAEADQDEVPVRLLALVDALGRRYARQDGHEREREEALARGEVERDLVIQVPASAGQAGEQLDAMLDETDEFCRKGTLLTLESPEDVAAFRRWYLREVTAQTAGEPATPWPGDFG